MRKEVQEAIEASTEEHAALFAIQAKLTKAEAKLSDINGAMRKLRDGKITSGNSEARTVENKLIAGITVPVEVVISSPDDFSLLAKAHEIVRRDEQHLRQQMEYARRDLSRAVAKRLLPQQKKLQARTVRMIEDITALCRDGEALEVAMTVAGLDCEGVFAVRFGQLQSLRTDRSGSHGLSIKAALEEFNG